MVVVLVLLAGAVGLVAADRAARRTAQARLAVQAQQELGTDGPPSVRIGGTSFLWQALRGHFSDVSLSAPRVTYQGATADDVAVRLRGVDVPRRVLAGSGGTVRIARGSAQVLLPWPALAARASAAAGTDVALRAAGSDVRASARVRLPGQDLPVSLRMAPRLARGQVVLRPRAATVGGRAVDLATVRPLLRAVGRAGLLDPVTVPVGALPRGVRLTGLHVAPRGVVLDAGLAGAIAVPAR